jgi:hydrogenase expression/formation protein HypE
VDCLPVGKLPAAFLKRLLAQVPVTDGRVLVGPGIGLDCAVIDLGPTCLVLKSDPITFASDAISWYAVQINANDLAVFGAEPRWLLATLLLPEGAASESQVEKIMADLLQACAPLGISLVGGHTEVTFGLPRPILVCTLVGEVPRQRLVTPRGAQAGDHLLLTKGVSIEATAILARESPGALKDVLSPSELETAANFLHDPGISVVRDAQLAQAAGEVHAMHDPTEGGLLGALWELAQASGKRLQVDLTAVPIPTLARRISIYLRIDPFAAIASGALLISAAAADAGSIESSLQASGIICRIIGSVQEGETSVVGLDGNPLPQPPRDEIARWFSSENR